MATCFGADALRQTLDNARSRRDEFPRPTTADPDELARTEDVLGDFQSWD
jgi:hypothetical protein